MTPIEFEGSQRNTLLRNLLLHLREKELARVQELRKDQAGDALSDPHDTLEDARADGDLELHADLISRSEDRLSEIHTALERLEGNTYGICAKCKREIDLARIRALPFTEFCADCEARVDAKRESRRGDIGGTTGDEFMAHWTVPEGMVERLGGEPLEVPDENPPEVAGETIIPAPAAISKSSKRQRSSTQSSSQHNRRKKSK